MNQLKNYLLSNLFSLLLTIFLPLFAIATVILFIKLATFTAVIQLNIAEISELYLFHLPQIIFYTLPVAFFVAITLTLFKFSNDNEIIVLFSLGIKPSYLLKILFKPALFLSTILFIIFFFIVPYTNSLTKNFMIHKKSEAKFNLEASEFGNKFGNWLLYIGTNNPDGSFSKIFLFNKNLNEETLVSAKHAKIFNDNGILRLKLFQGEGYTYSKKSFSQINFKTMLINNNIHTQYEKYDSALAYWKMQKTVRSRKTTLITNSLLALFPLLGLFFAGAIGIEHARHGKPKIYLYLFSYIVIYYGATIGLGKVVGFYTIPIVLITFFVGSYLLYRKKIARRF